MFSPSLGQNIVSILDLAAVFFWDAGQHPYFEGFFVHQNLVEYNAPLLNPALLKYLM